MGRDLIDVSWLGEEVVDTITGTRGICTAICEYHLGPRRIRMEWKTQRDGEHKEEWFDFLRIDLANPPG